MSALSKSIVLIGFQDQGNLGIGYLAATAQARGYEVHVLDFRQPREAIVDVVRTTEPLLVGFSLIFQYYLHQFAALARDLREQGVDCHFCVGGHFPSLRYEAVLDAASTIDSVVRFEGEETLIDLAECLETGRDWRALDGIAYRNEGGIVATAVRPLIGDLDALPFPYRPFESGHVLGRKFSPILASRGCARSCSFCSIQKFYSIPKGRIVRRRTPANVVAEMQEIHERHNVSIFLFQDDDFPVIGKPGRRWLGEFTDLLGRSGLIDHVIWKISCRADEIDRPMFAELRDAGLYMVYLGLESGNEEGLKELNKKLTLADNIDAVATLKELGLLVQYGFMLFDPSSTFQSVRENVSFLRRIVGDGSGAAVFCRMLPYAGTAIEAQLVGENRLVGDVSDPDYLFLDRRLNDFFDRMMAAAMPWMGGEAPVSEQLNWAWQEVFILDRLFPPMAGFEPYREHLRSMTATANAALFDALDESATAFEAEGTLGPRIGALGSLCRQTVADLLNARNAFMLRHQKRLLDAIATKADSRSPRSQQPVEAVQAPI